MALARAQREAVVADSCLQPGGQVGHQLGQADGGQSGHGYVLGGGEGGFYRVQVAEPGDAFCMAGQIIQGIFIVPFQRTGGERG